MRLLKCNNLGQISRTADLIDSDIPEYAILSHTWGPDADEVSFDDIENGTFWEKPGYYKIRFCAHQAAKDGLHHFWIDTCCINKSDQKELFTSLRSMWRWYLEAKRCYVLLSDVSKPESAQEFSDWALFRASRWFTRGWTLQELLAPTSVEFFSSEGHSIGTKRSLEGEISEITRIPIGALRNESLSEYSIQDRFRWQERRETRDAEDLVYSMFGIFNTWLVVQYGEGVENARARLERKLSRKRSTQDESVKTSEFLPFPRDPYFVTRPEFDETKVKLTPRGSWMALVGLGGVGKSQLAMDYSYKIKETYTRTYVLWIYCSSAARFDQSVHKLVRDLNMQSTNDDTGDAFGSLNRWLNVTWRRWLLVLDNADDVGFLFKPPERDQNQDYLQRRKSLAPQPRISYIPHCGHGRVLVTSRSRTSALKLVNDIDIIDLQPEKAHAIELLTKRLGATADTETIEQLAEKLDYFPLAIVQATAYIAERKATCTSKDYLGLLQQSSEKEIELLSKHEEGLGFRRDLQDANNSIIITWQLSFEHIHQTQTSAANLLSLMSFYNYQGIPLSLLKAREELEQYDEVTRSIGFRKRLRKALRAMDFRGYAKRGSSMDEGVHQDEGSADLTYCADNLDADIQTLRDYNLISISADGSLLSMHRLVQVAAQLWLQSKSKEQYTWLQTQSLQKLAAAFPRHSAYDRWERCRLLYPHARLAQSFKVTEPEVKLAQAAVLHIAAWFANEKGAFDEAEELACQSSSIYNEVYGDVHRDTLATTNEVAWTYWNQRRYEESIELQTRVLTVRSRELGPDHPATLLSMNKVTMIMRHLNMTEEAEQFEAQFAASSRTRQDRPSYTSDATSSINSLEIAFWGTGQWDEALELQRRTMESCQRVLKPDHPDTLMCMSHLAATYLHIGKLQAARDLLRRCVEAQIAKLGANNPQTKDSILWLQDVEKRMDSLESSGDEWQEVSAPSPNIEEASG